ncbi:MAG: hypothetical protein PHT16_02865 [Candidatus Pacebacteria bacterium]|nr:hypothetical protein [Candidatus Paceibacterota bacterium]
MKFIFDFDDVLFYNSDKLKKRIYFCLDKAGIPYGTAEAYYKKVRGGEFSLKDFLSELVDLENKKDIEAEELHEEIMSECPNFINTELVNLVQKFGKENCYLVTYGGYEHNKNKVERSGLAPLFSEIHIVSKSKKEAVEKICAKHKDEKVIFIDDKIKHFENLDFKKYPNLQTILFDDNGFEKFLSILPPL